MGRRNTRNISSICKGESLKQILERIKEADTARKNGDKSVSLRDIDDLIVLVLSKLDRSRKDITSQKLNMVSESLFEVYKNMYDCQISREKDRSHLDAENVDISKSDSIDASDTLPYFTKISRSMAESVFKYVSTFDDEKFSLMTGVIKETIDRYSNSSVSSSILEELSKRLEQEAPTKQLIQAVARNVGNVASRCPTEAQACFDVWKKTMQKDNRVVSAVVQMISAKPDLAKEAYDVIKSSHADPIDYVDVLPMVVTKVPSLSDKIYQDCVENIDAIEEKIYGKNRQEDQGYLHYKQSAIFKTMVAMTAKKPEYLLKTLDFMQERVEKNEANRFYCLSHTYDMVYNLLEKDRITIPFAKKVTKLMETALNSCHNEVNDKYSDYAKAKLILEKMRKERDVFDSSSISNLIKLYNGKVDNSEKITNPILYAASRQYVYG